MKKLISCFLLACMLTTAVQPIYATETEQRELTPDDELKLLLSATAWTDLIYYYMASTFYSKLDKKEQEIVGKKALCDAQLINIPTANKNVRDLLYEIYNYKLNAYKPLIYAEAKKYNIPTENKSLQYVAQKVIQARLEQGCP
ncbi:hypothetical protein [Priestia taiwanensis]|uniref:Uncharacterized protein n=1 Tax=Priestia taiwanensis TaxID=1347902 RepID=A0A917ER92_9BACI|nr:hypothetical protein [Priestia taiwanensis]MBM7363874.1 hypothetical protein [Priestia taiwanensis]GGE69705.1 hypothetical protein GCM10007140_19670 [Priestia taiwanensis]